MDTLASYIKSQPRKTMAEWATDFGISRPHLHSLLTGGRNPSPDVAIKIAAVTGGQVPVAAWPNLSRVADAVRGAA
jgi:plasmid maintenance system antidote protein VapI